MPLLSTGWVWPVGLKSPCRAPSPTLRRGPRVSLPVAGGQPGVWLLGIPRWASCSRPRTQHLALAARALLVAAPAPAFWPICPMLLPPSTPAAAGTLPSVHLLACPPVRLVLLHLARLPIPWTSVVASEKSPASSPEPRRCARPSAHKTMISSAGRLRAGQELVPKLTCSKAWLTALTQLLKSKDQGFGGSMGCPGSCPPGDRNRYLHKQGWCGSALRGKRQAG